MSPFFQGFSNIKLFSVSCLVTYLLLFFSNKAESFIVFLNNCFHFFSFKKKKKKRNAEQKQDLCKYCVHPEKIVMQHLFVNTSFNYSFPTIAVKKSEILED